MYVPSVQLSSKARKLGLFIEILGHDFVGKTFLLKDDKSTTVRKPSDDIRKILIGEDFHHLKK